MELLHHSLFGREYTHSRNPDAGGEAIERRRVACRPRSTSPARTNFCLFTNIWGCFHLRMPPCVFAQHNEDLHVVKSKFVAHVIALYSWPRFSIKICPLSKYMLTIFFRSDKNSTTISTLENTPDTFFYYK